MMNAAAAALIESLLKSRIGLDAAAIGAGTIERAVRERVAAVQAADTGAYWNLLHAVPDEIQALIEAVVVPETWFFRHREALLALGRFAAHRIFADHVPLLRVLSVPCSTGEEPYSIAMALLDAGIAPERFRVDAVDISARALARAQAGEFGPNSFRGAPLDFRDRHFTRTADGYAIADSIRAQVRFLRGNVLDANLLAGEPPYHFVFCRNLLIYFDGETQLRAVRALSRLAATDGMIFVGPAEASVMSQQGMVPAGVPLAFAFHKPAPGMTSTTPSPPPWQPPPAARAATRLPAQASAPARHPPAPAARMATYTPPDTPFPHGKSAAADADGAASGPALSAIATQADRGDLVPATEACLAHLAAHGPSAPAYCLLGVLYDAAGRAADAHGAYRKALYLDPAHEETLYHLAALLDAEGDHVGATRLRQRAQRHTRSDHA